MKKLYFLFFSSLIIYCMYFPVYKGFQQKTPSMEKLGYYPDSPLFRAFLGEFRWLSGYLVTFNAMTYYGGKMIALKRGETEDIEYQNLFKVLKGSAMTNPYLEDTYNLIEAIFPWEKGMIKETNEILEYISKYRHWDYRLPLYLGFNYAMFLKNYERAALYFQEAAKKSGNYLFASISAKYLAEVGEEDFAISFLEEMYNEAKDEGLKRHYLVRIETLKILKELNRSIQFFESRFNRKPTTLNDLVSAGILRKIPPHPRGGYFFIDKNGKAKSSK